MNEARSDYLELPVFALEELIDRQGMGEPHLVLRPEPVWRPESGRAAFLAEVGDALAEANVLDWRGRVDPNLIDLLPLFTAATDERFGWFTVEGTTMGVLAAARGLGAICAVVAHGLVRFARIPRDQLAQAVLDELPDTPAGSGTRWSLSLDELNEATAPAGVVDRPMPPDLAGIVNVLQRPITGSGELYTACRDSLNRRTVSASVHCADTDWGRYVNYTIDSGHEITFTVEPATPAAVLRALDDVGRAGRGESRAGRHVPGHRPR